MPLGTPGTAPPRPSSPRAATSPAPPSRARLVTAVLLLLVGGLFTFVFAIRDGLGGPYRLPWMVGFLASALAGAGILTYAVSVHGVRTVWEVFSGTGRTEPPEDRVETLSRKHPVWHLLVMAGGALLVIGGITLASAGGKGAWKSWKLFLVGGGLVHWGWQAHRRARERADAEVDPRRGG
jgi:hypothetical protein